MFSTLALLTILQAGTLHGTVRVETTLEPVPYATVEVVELDRAVATNDRGYYVVAGVPAGCWTVRVSALGYAGREFRVRVPADGSVRVDVELAVRPVELAGIAVEAEAGDAPVMAAGPPAVRIEGRKLSLVPGLAEADVFRALQMLPSVAAASDFSSALYVRGGLPNQNLILLDGMPLFNPYHLGGLFAAIDPDAVRSVDIHAGGFPASMGDRLSSVIRIRTHDGGRDRVRGSGAIGLFSSRVGLDGPLPGGDGSFLLTFRRTYLDLFTDAAKALGAISFTVPYAFTDAYMKLTRDVGNTGSLGLSVYLDGEGISAPDEAVGPGDIFEFDWGSRAASIRYRQPLSATLLGEFQLGWSSFYGSFSAINGPCLDCVNPGTPDTAILADSHVRDLRLSADFTWYRRSHELRSGLRLNRFDIRHAIPISDTDGFIPEFRSSSELITASAYIEDAWRSADGFRLRAGVRMLAADDRGIEWMPRLGARLEVTPRLSFSIAAGRYAQVLHSLKNPESLFAGLIAYDLVDAVPADLGYSTARDIVLGVHWANSTTNVRLDAYYKWMRDLLLSPLPDDPTETPPLAVERHRTGAGRARGIELFARQLWGEAEFTLAYTLATSDRRINGRTYEPRFQRRHTATATAIVPVGGSGTVSARLTWGTGQPYTPITGLLRPLRYSSELGAFTGVANRIVAVRGEHNSARLPQYFRLDVAARKSWNVDWFGTALTLTPYLQIINVLNTPNVLFGVPEVYGRPRLEFAPQLPFLPTFGLEWRF